MVKLLVIDDELAICDVLKEFFGEKGYKVFIATNADEGLSIVKTECPHIVLLDIIMPYRSGIDVLLSIKKINPAIKIIMLTAVNNEIVISQAKEYGASDYIIKPFSLNYLEKEVMPKVLKELV